MATGPAVRIEGLAALARSLKQVDVELPKELRRGLKRIADRVADEIRGKLPVGPSGKLRAGVVGRSTQRSASISWPRNSVPYAGFIEFGNKVGGGGGVGRRDSHPREFIAKGRYIFPTAEAKRGRIEAEIEDLVFDLLRKAGLT